MLTAVHKPSECAATPLRKLDGTVPCKQVSRSRRPLATATERAHRLPRRSKRSVHTASLDILQGQRQLTVNNPLWGEGNLHVFHLGFEQITNCDTRLAPNSGGKGHLVLLPNP